MPFNHQKYFDVIRESLFGGTMTQPQVDGQEAILKAWERFADDEDPRWLAYMLATAYHETATHMVPVSEYNHGAGQPYGEEDPETGQTYYGRGFVQITWRENYARSDREMEERFGMAIPQDTSCEWNADMALQPLRAAFIMFFGMSEGWFRIDENDEEETLARYFNDDLADPYEAREIINGDKHIVPDWGNGLSIGQLIEGYYYDFLAAIDAARVDAWVPPPPPVPAQVVEIVIRTPEGVEVVVVLNGREISDGRYPR